jgi:mercuric ion transport protein
MEKSVGAGVAAVGAAFASALCCAGPLIAVLLGVSGAGIAATFEPLRPWFLAGTGAFLLVGHVGLKREEARECEPGAACADPHVRRRRKAVLWIATVLAIVFATYPTWSGWVL